MAQTKKKTAQEILGLPIPGKPEPLEGQDPALAGPPHLGELHGVPTEVDSSFAAEQEQEKVRLENYFKAQRNQGVDPVTGERGDMYMAPGTREMENFRRQEAAIAAKEIYDNRQLRNEAYQRFVDSRLMGPSKFILKSVLSKVWEIRRSEFEASLEYDDYMRMNGLTKRPNNGTEINNENTEY